MKLTCLPLLFSIGAENHNELKVNVSLFKYVAWAKILQIRLKTADYCAIRRFVQAANVKLWKPDWITHLAVVNTNQSIMTLRSPESDQS